MATTTREELNPEKSFDDLLAIFAINKLRQLKKYCRDVTIKQSDLANLILWCMSGSAPYHHTPHHRQFVPEHLHLSDTDLSALALNGVGPMGPAAKKTANKVGAIFSERRMLSGHMFQNLNQWHFFYFDNHDQDRYSNHWAAGPHIHLINHLSPGRSAQSVLTEFCDGNPLMKGALHIRFVRIERSAWGGPENS